MGKDKKHDHASLIALNKKARHDYSIEETFEAGIVLEGWEVKSLRDKRVQIRDSYVIIKNGEAFLLNCHITPMPSASTHINPDASRSRKLLLHKNEISKLIGYVEKKGYTLVPLKLYWKKGMAKCEVALVRGKKDFDKREDERSKDWERDKARLLKRW